MAIKNTFIQTKKFLILLILFTLVSVTLVSVKWVPGFLGGDQIDPDYPNVQSFNYSFRLQNNLNRTVPKAGIDLYLPLIQNSSQRVLDHSFSSTDGLSVRVLEDSLGNKLLSLSLEALPRGYSTTVKIATKIGFSEGLVAFDEVDLNRYLAESDKGKALIGQLGIEFLAEDSVLKRVQELSEILSSDDSVVENSSTENVGNGEQQVETDTVKDRFVSDCLQQADRFITGARAVGIPARILVGFMRRGGNTFTLTCWPEVYDQSYWQMVDLANHRLIHKPIGDVVAVRVFISLEDYRQSQLSDLISEGYGLAVSYSIN